MFNNLDDNNDTREEVLYATSRGQLLFFFFCLFFFNLIFEFIFSLADRKLRRPTCLLF